MKRLLPVAIIFGLLVTVKMAYADSEQTGIVDMQFERTGVGIAPKNGWTTHYPISPIIIGQVLKEPIRKPQVLKEPIRDPQILREPTVKQQVLKEPVREPQVLGDAKPIPKKRLKKFLLGAFRKIGRFFKKIL